jgi:hypothetical protein
MKWRDGFLTTFEVMANEAQPDALRLSANSSSGSPGAAIEVVA